MNASAADAPKGRGAFAPGMVGSSGMPSSVPAGAVDTAG